MAAVRALPVAARKIQAGRARVALLMGMRCGSHRDPMDGPTPSVAWASAKA